MRLASVDWAALLEVVWSSALAGITLIVATSLGILGASRASTHRREGRGGAAGAYATLAFAAGIVCALGVVLAISVMLAKD
jgi:hypothetical protein